MSPVAAKGSEQDLHQAACLVDWVMRMPTMYQPPPAFDPNEVIGHRPCDV